MIFKRFYLPFLLIMLFVILLSCSFGFAQTTGFYPNLYYYYNYLADPNAIYSGASTIYPYYQSNPYSPYQSSYYWPNAAGGYINPYNQYTANATNYLPLATNPYSSLSAISSLNSLNPYSSLLYGSLGNYGYSSSLTNPYYSWPYNSTGGTSGNYTAQATNYYPSIYSGIQSILTGTPSALSTNILNPFASYQPNQAFYQNSYATYPYNYGTGQIYPNLNPYGYNYNPYSYYPTNYQSDPYSQPLPYYQPTNQANVLNVTGTWAGTWFTTLANGTVNNGDASLSLTQNGTEVHGSVTFSLNSYQKLNANINGTINGSTLSLNGTLSNGVETYTLTINGNLSSNNLSGTYSIKTNSGSVIESGTYTVSRL